MGQDFYYEREPSDHLFGLGDDMEWGQLIHDIAETMPGGSPRTSLSSCIYVDQEEPDDGSPDPARRDSLPASPFDLAAGGDKLAPVPQVAEPALSAYANLDMFALPSAGVANIDPLLQANIDPLLQANIDPLLQANIDPFLEQYSLDPALQQSSLVPGPPPHHPSEPQYAARQPRNPSSRVFVSHRREHKYSISNHPTRFYESLPSQPKNWGFNQTTGRPAFVYTEKGELEPKKTYSTQHIYEFIKKRPVQEDGEHLILWIQHPPAQFTHRYPRGLDSGMCRWKRCPIKNNTILKGHWRVALDERGDELGDIYDPFHCAGYVHLYCMEKMFDLVELFIDPGVDIRPDTRRMKYEEKNPMSITRDHSMIIDVLKEWEVDQIAKYQASDPSRRRQRTEDDFLYRCMTAKHLELEITLRGRFKDERDGVVHLGRYLGDLHLYAALKGERLTWKKGGALDATWGNPEVDPMWPGTLQQTPVWTGPITQGPITWGPIAQGPIAQGPITRGPVTRGPITRGPITRKRGREEPDDTWVPEQYTAKKRKLPVASGQGPSAVAFDGYQRLYLPPVPPPRKRGREESDGADPTLEQKSPRRPKFSAVGGQAGTAADLDNLQRVLIRQGPVTRRQSLAMRVVLDKLSSGERNETRHMVQLIQALPLGKKRAVYNLAVKQAGSKRRLASI